MNVFIHRAIDRGVGEHGWLHTRFSFSFADWYNPRKMGFGVLRVLNDDIIDPHSGFGKHPHANMEIITIVRKGAVSHEDSMGNRYDVPAGDVQVMSAGTGVVHGEFNHGDEVLELFQVWIEPRTKNISPRYQQKSFGVAPQRNTIELLVSGDGASGTLTIHQDAYMSRARVAESVAIEYVLRRPDNGVYIFVVEGSVSIDGDTLGPRDAIGLTDTSHVVMHGVPDAEVLIFEAPMK